MVPVLEELTAEQVKVERKYDDKIRAALKKAQQAIDKQQKATSKVSVAYDKATKKLEDLSQAFHKIKRNCKHKFPPKRDGQFWRDPCTVCGESDY